MPSPHPETDAAAGCAVVVGCAAWLHRV